MNLTTLARVTALIGVSALETENQALVEAFIASVSADMEKVMARGVEAKERTQVHYIGDDTKTIALPCYPVTSVVAVRVNTVPDWTDVDPLERNVDYTVNLEEGVITFLGELDFLRDATGFVAAKAAVQIQYVGGMAADTSTFIASFPDVAGQCDLQVRYLYQRRDNLGGNAKTNEGETAFKDSYDLLPSVRRVCEYHRRDY